MTEFKTFKEISVGGIPKASLLKRLAEARVQCNEYANILFEHPAFSPGDSAETVKLVKVKLSDLKLANPCSLREIIENASNLALKHCPLYLAAFLRLEYLDQPKGPYLTVASLRPEADEDYPSGFYIRNLGDSLWLRGYRASGQCEWPEENEFVFLK